MERELTLEEKEQKVKDSKSGTKFSDLEDIIVVYISELDIFREEKVLYHVDSVIRETGTISGGRQSFCVSQNICLLRRQQRILPTQKSEKRSTQKLSYAEPSFL